MSRRRALAITIAILPVLVLPASSTAQGRFDLGPRLVLSLADGEPANDIPGYGIFGHWRWSERWALGFAADVAEYDFEEPAKQLGIAQDPAVEVVDAKAEGTTFSVWFERLHPRAGGRSEWFWGAGIGLASIDVPDARGPVAGGGGFDVETDAGEETVVSVLGGWRRRFGARWSIELGLHLDQHFADWQLRDRVSGRTGSIDDYSTYGGTAGLSFRF